MSNTSKTEKKRKARSLIITVDKDGRMLCKFWVRGRLTAQCSYRPKNDHLDIYTGANGTYAWLAGKED